MTDNKVTERESGLGNLLAHAMDEKAQVHERLDAALRENVRLRQALEHIRRHQAVIAGESVKHLSATWLIANRALADGGA